MPKIGTLIRCYHATQYLPLVLKQYEWVDKVVVLNYRFESVVPVSDDTEDIVNAFNHPNLIFKKGVSHMQHETMNMGLDLLNDCDVVYFSDADEIIFPDDQYKIKLRLLDSKDAGCLACRTVDYNGDIYHTSPERNYNSVVAIVPQRARFGHIRSMRPDTRRIECPEIIMHHLGLIFTPEVIEWKSNWEYKEERHSRDILLENWKKRREVTPPEELVNLLKEFV